MPNTKGSVGTGVVKTSVDYMYIPSDFDHAKLLNWLATQAPGIWVIETNESLKNSVMQLKYYREGQESDTALASTILKVDHYIVFVHDNSNAGIGARIVVLSPETFTHTVSDLEFKVQ